MTRGGRWGAAAAVVACVLVATPARAEEPLALDEVLRAVRDRFPPLQAVADDRAAAQAELYAARGGWDPILKLRLGGIPYGGYQNLRFDAFIEQPTPLWGLSVIGGYRLGIGDFPVYDGKLVTASGGELRLGLSLPVLRNGSIDRRRASIRRAELGTKIAERTYRREELSTLQTAANRWIEWVAAGQRLATQRALLDIALVRDGAVRRRIATGDLPAIEETENARAVAQRQAAVVAAERGVEQAAIELGLYLGEPDAGRSRPPPPARLPGALAAPTVNVARFEDALAVALARRPEMQRLEAQREQTAVDLKLQRNQLLPALDLFGQVSYDMGALPADPVFAKSVSKPYVETGLTFELPIPNRAARGKVRAAEAQLRRAGRLLEYARDRIAADVRDAMSALGAAQARLRLSARELELARELEAGERKKFDAGDSTLFFVNQREQATAEAAIRAIDATADAHKSWIAYLTAIGTGASEN